jgi:hypothetical protein
MAKSNLGLRQGRPRLDFTLSLSTPVMAKDFVDFFHGKLVESHDLGLSAESGRQNETSLVLAVHFHGDPGVMIAVQATPVRIGQKMGTGLEKNLDNTGTCNFLGRVWNFNKKFCHGANAPFQNIFYRRLSARAFLLFLH